MSGSSVQQHVYVYVEDLQCGMFCVGSEWMSWMVILTTKCPQTFVPHLVQSISVLCSQYLEWPSNVKLINIPHFGPEQCNEDVHYSARWSCCVPVVLS